MSQDLQVYIFLKRDIKLLFDTEKGMTKILH